MSQRLRVLCLATEAYGGRGGIAQACRDVIDALAADDQVEQIDVLPRYAPDPPRDVPHKARQRTARQGRIGFALSAIGAARGRPDIIFCNHLFMAPLAAAIASCVGAKLIIQLHGIEIWQTPSLMRRRALEAADLVWCVSRDTRARAIAHADIIPERAIVVNNCVGARFSPGDRMRAFDIIYIIAGEGDDRRRLDRIARERNVHGRVRFLGNVNAEDLPDVYRAADLFVLPSTGEGFGIAFLEAMSCGTPAIGLATGGASDALADGELGACVPEALPNAFARSCERAR